ncbi:lysylphosphatidylglycerol synthase domain-containing protein [Subsaxibacter sp. CAU 1640]|uniref:lysylphosphatidylglycerol synthase domain-containing protein n=1 Tax=Subsaxibacter sp. CAU 1640 TaxID=2933271 RepID=UPI002004E1CD|nr:lysylphosphatidylglycerol synthase domain-containing protein [Subsaxibacter sp. CAU 1640]MCK7589120.1 lysylphosphatidylglycerol synthase domain-containing protein [Subsaxibacter sp. CAU 1640]
MLLKLSIVVGAFYVIIDKLTSNDELEFQTFFKFLREKSFFSVKTIFFLLILTVFNWFLEILKWKTLVSLVIPISLKNTFEQSLGALTASLLTPNRIGEYGAKAIYYAKPFRKKIMLLNLLGNMMQMTATVLFGIVGIVLLMQFYHLQLNYTLVFILIAIFLIVALLIVFALKTDKFEIKGFSAKKIKGFLKSIPSNLWFKGLTLSVGRYLIFSFQFYVLLKTFGAEIGYFQAIMVITSMYLVASVVPSISIFDVVIKGSVAVYLFSFVGVNNLTVLCVVMLMWILNFVIPSIFGSYYVLNFNFPKSEDSL